MRATILGIALAGVLATTASAQVPVKIGVITTLSGPAGYLGQDVRDGLQLAIDEEGGKLGGVPVELLVEDDDRKPGTGRQIAEKFVGENGVKLVTGIIFSNVAGAVVPEVVDSAAIYISPNAGPSNLAGKECNENYFVVSWQNDSLHETAGLAANKLGYKKAFLLAPNYQAGQDALAGFKRTFKGEIAGEIFTQLDQTDYSAEMAQIRAAGPDVVYQFHPGGLGIAFTRQYQQAGLLSDIPMVLSEANADGVLLKALGDAAVGLSATAHWNADFENDASKAFVAGWRKAYGDRPATTYASQGYDTGKLIASALKATGGDGDVAKLREALQKAEFASVRGSFAFGPNQHPIQDWYLLKVVKNDAGVAVTRTVEKLVENYGDAYSAECKM